MHPHAHCSHWRSEGDWEGSGSGRRKRRRRRDRSYQRSFLFVVFCQGGQTGDQRDVDAVPLPEERKDGHESGWGSERVLQEERGNVQTLSFGGN